MTVYDSYLVNLCDMFHVKLSNGQVDQFNRYYELLVKKNEVMNLTAITDYHEVCLKHFADSISLSQYYDMSSVDSLIDVGTGAGFPGIPLKILFPHLNVTLLDSLNKRLLFLEDVIDELDLDNIKTVHSRAEEAGRMKNLRENYDLCVSRAVANLSTLSEYCLPLVKVGGNFISYKAGEVEDEINSAKHAIKKLGGKIKSVEEFSLPDSDISRSFVIIEKVNETSNLYPRKPGTPNKKPL
ncbi:16S rRNA (guanine(527)-N(7))-methyltransferase RsmG [Sharpea azabuensis]|uniref:16S rRNA (guanine(527)-N(7))-methyltransferase RsmG n=1 Tax=Sharpea azabuensis TaxID=322505 RepID=UPI0015693E6F|nr:16S rRNA (guanine(527)-N(7))-methyltransferase RsmG [Sharpea azabuensis]